MNREWKIFTIHKWNITFISILHAYTGSHWSFTTVWTLSFIAAKITTKEKLGHRERRGREKESLEGWMLTTAVSEMSPQFGHCHVQLQKKLLLREVRTWGRVEGENVYIKLTSQVSFLLQASIPTWPNSKAQYCDVMPLMWCMYVPYSL